MARRFLLYFSSMLLLSAALGSCVGIAPTREVHLVDSLNRVAYRMRYVNIDSSASAAVKAYRACKFYTRGKAEACNNLAFCSYIRMDFERAEELYKEVPSITKNETELLIADIELMKIYQRTSMNEDFYDCRNDARRRMKRIDQEQFRYMSPHDIQRLNYAYTEFGISSAIYYYYLRQHNEAVSSINSVDQKKLASDSCQWLYYHYIKGGGALCTGATHDEMQLNCFDELFDTWKESVRNKIIYFEANSLQSLSDMMLSNEDFQFFKERRGYMLSQMNLPIDTLLSLRLAEKSLEGFKKYRDLYQIASSNISIAKYNNIHGRYQEALNALCQALQCVNEHHRLYYHHSNLKDKLSPFAPYDSITTELKWISQEGVKTVPEWISSIREQLSVSYAGLNNKPASDYNRNAYLDIMNYTRQDKELQSRYNALKAELNTLNVIFFITILTSVLVAFLLWFFNKRARLRDKLHAERLRKTLTECRQITTFTSEQAQEKLEELEHAEIHNKDDKVMIHVMLPYVKWVIDNRKTLLLLSEEHNRLNKEHYISEQHIIENKRQNIVKKTCLSIINGINPYIDRILNEVRKLQSPKFDNSEKVHRERLLYVDELVTTINEYNDILTQWIKMKQGSLSLNIESFELNELFSLVEKGRRTFEMKRQHFVVDETDAIVKADKALTLFMINTLAENARKYTPEGGTVHISAREDDRFVEISVEDTGIGLSPEDVQQIIGEKVYDSSKIGMKEGSDVNALKKNKGYGFGLMNCKGIIEKYRKTNSFFDVCLFNIESTLGKGSRFFFRLPKGIRKMTMILLCLFSFFLSSCHHENELKDREMTIDSIAAIEKKPGFEVLLDKASHFADLTYYSNVDHRYKDALQYADSAISCLNAHYRKYSRHPRFFMQLVGDGTPAEIEWWNRLYDSDFHIILDIRNESAVAFLALKQLNAYKYNNDAYTSLYKLLGEDKTLSEYCRHLQRSTTDKTVELTICFFLLVIAVAAYYFFFVRKRIINRMNLEQVFVINEIILKASLKPLSERRRDSQQNVEDTFTEIPRNIVYSSFDAVNELVPIDRMGLAVYSAMTKYPVFVCNPPLDVMPEDIQKCYDLQNPVTKDNREMFPLNVDTVDGQRCVGVFYLEIHEGTDIGSDRLLVQLVAEYMAIVVLNSVLNLASNYQDIESAQEEIDRASFEDSQLHVQNMVLDNCLSTIKHETIYYPNKIKQIVTRLNGEEGSAESEKEDIEAISELIEYYRGIYTILNSCAARQLEGVTFRRAVMPVKELTDYAEEYFAKVHKSADNLTFVAGPISVNLIGDSILLKFLLENLLNEALDSEDDGKLILRAKDDGDFVRFDFIDTRRSFTQEELNKLFYPQRERMNYLICRQIIREHDEYAGKRGCRINAEPAADGGFSIYFTLTKKQ